MADVNKFIDELTAGTVTAGDETVVLRGGAAGTEYRVPLGTMAAQAASAVAITGGTVSGLSTFTVAGGATAAAIVGNSGNKIMSLIAGTSGSAFEYDSSGFFCVLSAANANVGQGTGTVRVSVQGSNGNVNIGPTTSDPGYKFRVETGDVNFAGGGRLVLTGGDTSGEGNIQMGAAASGAYDTNLIYLSSTAMTGGFLFGSTPTIDASNGSFMAGRGNTYSAVANQRGSLFIGAGNPSSPAATEGIVRFYTGATVERLRIGNAGRILSGATLPTDDGATGWQHSGAMSVSTTLATPAINGGTAANDDITIQGTTNATRTTSYVNLQPNGGFVGIGIAVPTTFVHAASAIQNAAQINLDGTYNGANNIGFNWLGKDDANASKQFARLIVLNETRTAGAERGQLRFYVMNGGSISTEMMTILGANVGIRTVSPQASLHLPAGTATASTAPLKLTNGIRLTAKEVGVGEMESNFYLTNWKSLRFPLGGPIFDHFADANNGTTVETDLYSATLLANTFAINGDKVVSQYGGIFVGDATSTQRLRAYFGGTLIFDSGATGFGVGTTHWNLVITCVRESSSIVRCSATLNTSFASLSAYSTYTKVTGLTLTNTQPLKITGTAAGATGGSNQITASEGYVEYKPAVN